VEGAVVQLTAVAVVLAVTGQVLLTLLLKDIVLL
jgi:hypothetical protein